MMATARVERDSFGAIKVSACRLSGGQTQREFLLTEMEFEQWTQSE
jgi:fumarate hydratase class II